MKISLVKQEDIDKTKWNSCVHYALNGNIFGYKWYLDHIAKDWDALVEGDYESVFPLIWRPGWLNQYKELVQPALISAIGIYSVHVLSPKRVQAFLDLIPEAYRVINITVDEMSLPAKDNNFKQQSITNHQLLLREPYEVLEERFDPTLKVQIQQAESASLLPALNLKPEVVADFFKKHHPIKKNKDEIFHALQRIMYNVLHRGWGFSSGVKDAEGNLLAANFFIFSHGKVMSLIPTASKEGEQLGALPFLFDLLIKAQAGKPLILDFNKESADLAVAFGAKDLNYYQIQRDLRKWGVF